MPFKTALKDTYNLAIRPAAESCGYRVVRVDELKGPYNIHREIIEYIFESDLVIADMTGHNPNVFYEMGVAHAIGNKTIMIIKEGDQRPFDVSTYASLAYTFGEAGYNLLKNGLIEQINHFEHWSRKATNPVQEYKPFKEREGKDDLESLQMELVEMAREKEAYRIQIDFLKASLEEIKKESSLQKSESPSLKIENRKAHETIIRLRSEPWGNVDAEDVKQMLRAKDFYCGGNFEWSNPGGKGIQHQYGRDGKGETVFDNTTGLIWQRFGSSEWVGFGFAKEYVKRLNEKEFADLSDWRLPTLEEAMSLMEREKKNGNLFIDPIFGEEQVGIWTADLYSASRAWYVNFDFGLCLHRHVVNLNGAVRAVRSA